MKVINVGCIEMSIRGISGQQQEAGLRLEYITKVSKQANKEAYKQTN